MNVRRYVVECEISVSESDVWDYLEYNDEDIDELQAEGYEFTDEDWENTAKALFEDDNYTYYDFDFVQKK